MNIKSTIIRILAAAAFALLPSFVSAQPDSIRKIGYQADSLRRAYRFQEAMDTYGRALDMFTDSLMTAEDSLLAQDLSDRFLMAENGRNMMVLLISLKVSQWCTRPLNSRKHAVA